MLQAVGSLAEPEIPQPPPVTCSLASRQTVSVNTDGNLSVTGTTTYAAAGVSGTDTITGKITGVDLIENNDPGCDKGTGQYPYYVRLKGSFVRNFQAPPPLHDSVSQIETYTFGYADASTAQQAVAAIRCIALHAGCDDANSGHGGTVASAETSSSDLTVAKCKGATIKVKITHGQNGDDAHFSVVNNSGNTLAVAFGPIVFTADTGDSNSTGVPGFGGSFGTRELHPGSTKETTGSGYHPFDAPVNGDVPRIMKITIVNVHVANLDIPPKAEEGSYLAPIDYPDKTLCGPFTTFVTR